MDVLPGMPASLRTVRIFSVSCSAPWQLLGALAVSAVALLLLGDAALEVRDLPLKPYRVAHAGLEALDGGGEPHALRPRLAVLGERRVHVSLDALAARGHVALLLAQVDQLTTLPPQLVEGAVIIHQDLGLLVAVSPGEVFQTGVAAALLGGEGLGPLPELGDLAACGGELVGLEHLARDRHPLALERHHGARARDRDQDRDAHGQEPQHQQDADKDPGPGEDGAAEDPLPRRLALALAGFEDLLDPQLGLTDAPLCLLGLGGGLCRDPLVVEDEAAVLGRQVFEALFEAVELVDGRPLVHKPLFLAPHGGVELALVGLEALDLAEELRDAVRVVLADGGEAAEVLEVTAGRAQGVAVELRGALLRLFRLAQQLEALAWAR